MSPFLAAELGAAFSVAVAQRIGLLPVIWTAESPEQALADSRIAPIVFSRSAELRTPARAVLITCRYLTCSLRLYP